MKARFQIFKAPFYFVGWLAPAYGKDTVNPNGIPTLFFNSKIPLYSAKTGKVPLPQSDQQGANQQSKAAQG